jgi:hypothetical protein
MKKTIICLSVGVFLLTLFLSLNTNIALAEGILPDPSGPTTGCPEGYTGNCGNYSLNDFMLLAVKISNWILGIVGSAALLMFVYGGLMFVMSGGSEERVSSGKKIIIGSVVGLAIVFTSYLIIQFTMNSLGFKNDWSNLNNSVQQAK